MEFDVLCLAFFLPLKWGRTMTESDWLECTNPHRMLDFLTSAHVRRRWFPWFRSRAECDLSRKKFLFALACCRRLDEMLIDVRSRQALDIARRYVDHEASKKAWRVATLAASCAAIDASSPHIGVAGWRAAAQARAAEAVAGALCEPGPANTAAARAREAVKARARGLPSGATPTSSSSSSSQVIIAASTTATAPKVPPPENIAWETEAKVQCDVVRDVFGDPFRAVKIDAPAAKLAPALAIARRIYQEERFADMPCIAAALAAAGIEEAAIASHCQRTEGHVRGCWVIDLLLDKSTPLLAMAPRNR
jgi:hypothetical protein